MRQAAKAGAYKPCAPCPTNGVGRSGHERHTESSTSARRAMNKEQWVTAVLRNVAANPPGRFAGIGLVLYVPPLDLPVAPLVPPSQIPPLPSGDVAESTRLLRQLADSACPLHDGFHLVDTYSLAITHLCHFFAPPIPAELPPSVPAHPVGARFMAALLGSLLPSVVMTSVLGEREGAIVIERGVIRVLKLTDV